jgi:hypothetical protein
MVIFFSSVRVSTRKNVTPYYHFLETSRQNAAKGLKQENTPVYEPVLAIYCAYIFTSVESTVQLLTKSASLPAIPWQKSNLRPAKGGTKYSRCAHNVTRQEEMFRWLVKYPASWGISHWLIKYFASWGVFHWLIKYSTGY